MNNKGLKIIAVLLALAIIVSCVKPYKVKAYADAMTASMLGSVAYAIMQSSGISFTAGNASGTGMNSFMTGQIESYVNSKGGSLTSLFGGEMARIAAGKLVVGQQMYNGVLSFVDWLKEEYSLSSSDLALTEGNYKGKEIPYSGMYETGSIPDTGVHIRFYGQENEYFINVASYVDGKRTSYTNYNSPLFPLFNGSYTLAMDGHILVCYAERVYSDGSISSYQRLNVATVDGGLDNSLLWSVPENWGEPQPLPENEEWQGDFTGTPGFADPPTDLPDFLSRIPEAIADNSLVVTEEIVDTGGSAPTPSPSPSPVPTPQPYPGLSIAEKIALILGEIVGVIFDTKGDTAQETIDEIAQQVEQTTEGIAESITDPITQTQTQTQQQIIDSTQTITDTITQTQTQTQEQLQDIAQTITETQTQTQEQLQDITQTITDITSVPEPTSWDKVKKDLHGVFPFCIPWDIYGMLNAFNAEPQAPHFEYPFQIPSINLDYTLDLDFSDFDPVAQTLRTVELIAFCVGLAILTSKVIRW